MNTFFWIISWLISMILFVLILQYGNQQNASPVEITSLIVVVIFGIFSFSKFILIIEKAIKIKYPRIIGGFFSILAFIFSLGIGIGILILLFNVLLKPKNTNVQAEKTKYTLLQSPLKIGSSGEDVKVLQAVLKQNKNIYPSGAVSGYYGQLTKEAVTNFQKDNGLPQTGEMDEATISKFNEVYGSQSREQYLSTVAPISNPNPPEQTAIYNPAVYNQPVATSIPINAKVLVALPNGSTHSCDSSAQQAVRDAGTALTNAEQQKNDCISKYSQSDSEYNKSCLSSCNSVYGLDKPAEYESCKKACSDYYNNMSSAKFNTCNTYSQAQKTNLDYLIGKYCN